MYDSKQTVVLSYRSRTQYRSDLIASKEALNLIEEGFITKDELETLKVEWLGVVLSANFKETLRITDSKFADVKNYTLDFLELISSDSAIKIFQATQCSIPDFLQIVYGELNEDVVASFADQHNFTSLKELVDFAQLDTITRAAVLEGVVTTADAAGVNFGYYRDTHLFNVLKTDVVTRACETGKVTKAQLIMEYKNNGLAGINRTVARVLLPDNFVDDNYDLASTPIELLSKNAVEAFRLCGTKSSHLKNAILKDWTHYIGRDKLPTTLEAAISDEALEVYRTGVMSIQQFLEKGASWLYYILNDSRTLKACEAKVFTFDEIKKDVLPGGELDACLELGTTLTTFREEKYKALREKLNGSHVTFNGQKIEDFDPAKYTGRQYARVLSHEAFWLYKIGIQVVEIQDLDQQTFDTIAKLPSNPSIIREAIAMDNLPIVHRVVTLCDTIFGIPRRALRTKKASVKRLGELKESIQQYRQCVKWILEDCDALQGKDLSFIETIENEETLKALASEDALKAYKAGIDPEELSTFSPLVVSALVTEGALPYYATLKNQSLSRISALTGYYALEVYRNTKLTVDDLNSIEDVEVIQRVLRNHENWREFENPNVTELVKVPNDNEFARLQELFPIVGYYGCSIDFLLTCSDSDLERIKQEFVYNLLHRSRVFYIAQDIVGMSNKRFELLTSDSAYSCYKTGKIKFDSLKTGQPEELRELVELRRLKKLTSQEAAYAYNAGLTQDDVLTLDKAGLLRKTVRKVFSDFDPAFITTADDEYLSNFNDERCLKAVYMDVLGFPKDWHRSFDWQNVVKERERYGKFMLKDILNYFQNRNHLCIDHLFSEDALFLYQNGITFGELSYDPETANSPLDQNCGVINLFDLPLSQKAKLLLSRGAQALFKSVELKPADLNTDEIVGRSKALKTGALKCPSMVLSLTRADEKSNAYAERTEYETLEELKKIFFPWQVKILESEEVKELFGYNYRDTFLKKEDFLEFAGSKGLFKHMLSKESFEAYRAGKTLKQIAKEYKPTPRRALEEYERRDDLERLQNFRSVFTKNSDFENTVMENSINEARVFNITEAQLRALPLHRLSFCTKALQEVWNLGEITFDDIKTAHFFTLVTVAACKTEVIKLFRNGVKFRDLAKYPPYAVMQLLDSDRKVKSYEELAPFDWHTETLNALIKILDEKEILYNTATLKKLNANQLSSLFFIVHGSGKYIGDINKYVDVDDNRLIICMNDNVAYFCAVTGLKVDYLLHLDLPRLLFLNNLSTKYKNPNMGGLQILAYEFSGTPMKPKAGEKEIDELKKALALVSTLEDKFFNMYYLDTIQSYSDLVELSKTVDGNREGFYRAKKRPQLIRHLKAKFWRFDSAEFLNNYDLETLAILCEISDSAEFESLTKDDYEYLATFKLELLAEFASRCHFASKSLEDIVNDIMQPELLDLILGIPSFQNRQLRKQFEHIDTSGIRPITEDLLSKLLSLGCRFSEEVIASRSLATTSLQTCSSTSTSASVSCSSSILHSGLAHLATNFEIQK